MLHHVVIKRVCVLLFHWKNVKEERLNRDITQGQKERQSNENIRQRADINKKTEVELIEDR